MRFYKGQHQYYCGIDLHARKMYVCILNQVGKTKVHKNIDTNPEAFFELIFPYLDDVAVAVECVLAPINYLDVSVRPGSCNHFFCHGRLPSSKDSLRLETNSSMVERLIAVSLVH